MNDNNDMPLEEGFSRIFTDYFANISHPHKLLIITSVNDTAKPGQQQNYATILAVRTNSPKEGNYLSKEDFSFERGPTYAVESSAIKGMCQTMARAGLISFYLPAQPAPTPATEMPSPQERERAIEGYFDKAAEGFFLSYLKSGALQNGLFNHNVETSHKKNFHRVLEELPQEERLGRLEGLCSRVKDRYIQPLFMAKPENAIARELSLFADEVELYRGLLPKEVVETLLEIVKPQRNIYSANVEWVRNKSLLSTLNIFTEWAREYCSLDESNAATVGRLRNELDDALTDAFPIGKYDRTTPSEALTSIGQLCDMAAENFEIEYGAGTDKLIKDLDFLIEEAEAYKSVLPHGAIELFEQVVRPIPNIFSDDSPWLINQNIPEAIEAYKKWLGFSCKLRDANELGELKQLKKSVSYWRKQVDSAITSGLAVD